MPWSVHPVSCGRLGFAPKKEVEAGRWLDGQGEIWEPGRLIELENELSEGREIIEAVMHQHDEG